MKVLQGKPFGTRKGRGRLYRIKDAEDEGGDKNATRWRGFNASACCRAVRGIIRGESAALQKLSFGGV